MDHDYDYWIGLCYLQLDKFDSSIYYLSKSINHEQNTRSDKLAHYLSWFYLGVVRYEIENYQEAINCFDSSLAIYNNFSDAEYYKAACLKLTKKNNDALNMILKADKDFKLGYTINEDDAIYEAYPYQINQHYYLDSAIKWIKSAN